MGLPARVIETVMVVERFPFPASLNHLTTPTPPVNDSICGPPKLTPAGNKHRQ